MGRLIAITSFLFGLAQLLAWGWALVQTLRMPGHPGWLCAFFAAEYVQSLFVIPSDIRSLTWWQGEWQPREAVILVLAGAAALQLILRATLGVRARRWAVAYSLGWGAFVWLVVWRIVGWHKALDSYEEFLALRLCSWAAPFLALSALCGYLWESDARIREVNALQGAAVLAVFAGIVTAMSSLQPSNDIRWFILRDCYRGLVVLCCVGWTRAAIPLAVQVRRAGLPFPSTAPPLSRRYSAAAPGIAESTEPVRLLFQIRFGPMLQFPGGAASTPAETPPPSR